MTTVDTILSLFAGAGQAAYYGEAVSQTEHALQSAHLAVVAAAAEDLVIAALLHDVGHLLGPWGEDIALQGIDDTHEAIGAAWLDKHFGPTVARPVQLHVAAKRYLCAVDPDYADRLSPASRTSLGLQGGAMSADEARQFEQDPHFAAAIALRHWDDAAKVPGLVVPGLDHYRVTLERARTRYHPGSA